MPTVSLWLAQIATSTGVVALAEIGDRTMLLTILLVSRFRRRWAVLAGVLVATTANHFIAAWIGATAAGLLTSLWFRTAVALGFIAMAGWTLVPDKLDGDEEQTLRGHGGAFLTTVVSFFLVEIGDKTQIATMALAARFHAVIPVAIGTTMGMMIADGPAVFLGEALVRRISLRLARIVAAALMAGLGIWQLLGIFGFA